MTWEFHLTKKRKKLKTKQPWDTGPIIIYYK